MINFITKNFLQVVIFILIITMFFFTCKKMNTAPTVIRDTTRIVTYVIKDTIINTKPILVKAERDTILEKTVREYIPNGDYNELAKQFQSLREELLARNIYKDQVKQDSSTVSIIDTIQQNKIIGRKIDFNLRYPLVTNTITITKTNPPTRKFFFGGELGGNKTNLVNQVELGLLYQAKNNNIYKIGGQLDFNGQIIYKVGLYKKIGK